MWRRANHSVFGVAWVEASRDRRSNPEAELLGRCYSNSAQLVADGKEIV